MRASRGWPTCANPGRSSRTPTWSGLLVRPEVYEDDEDKKDEMKGEAKLIIAKQRNGPTGDDRFDVPR